MKIGDEVYVHGYVDEIRQGVVIIRNDGGYFGTVPSEIKSDRKTEPKRGEWIDAEIPLECGGSMPIQVCNLCKTFYPLAHTGGGYRFCPNCGADMRGADDAI